MSLPRLGKRETVRDQRLELLLLKEIKQDEQILSKPFRSQPFKPLDAVRNDAFPAGKKPAAGNVHSEDRDGTKAMATT